MDKLEKYRKIIEDILTEYERIPYAHGDFRSEAVFDREHNRFLLVNVGWDSKRRVHGTLVHVDIIDGKVWVQRHGTEHGIAKELTKAGVPKEDIVLGFHPADVRPHTEYAAG
jgi:hypothetical protein